MSESELNLLNPPIVEAVLDIECDLPPGQQLAALEGAAQERFRERYPKFRTKWVQEHLIAATPGGPPDVSVPPQRVEAFQFLQDDEKQLVQVRAQGFSFNRLAPYTSLDDYVPALEQAWRVYVGLAAPVQIRLIRLRYINRILLPFLERTVNLDNFFTVGPRLPDEKNLVFTSFFNQHTAVELQTGHQVNIVLTSQPPQGDQLPVIFDNCVAASEPGEPENWDWILTTIRSLRDLKNRIFKKSLTEQCLKLFQNR
ncbi:TIGR04255 family protein [Candidatus Methylomirabilis sp.]|uniref:TIGR04255 family protein n=1 Tax=Candidatus Methylomirabilis sp. TaxID=2032687 RepID=UPI0030761D53